MPLLVIVYDGSYIPYMTKTVYSAALIVYCKVTKQRYKGSVVENSRDTDNYCAEILGRGDDMT